MTAVTPFTGRIIAQPKIQKGSGKRQDSASLRIAVNERKNDDGEHQSDLLWATVYGDFAHNVVNSFAPLWDEGQKSVRVTGTGRYHQYEGKVTVDGEVIEGIEKVSFNVLSIGPDLRFATATPEDVGRSGGGSKPRKASRSADVDDDGEDEVEETTDDTEETKRSSRPRSRAGSTGPKTTRTKKTKSSDVAF